MLADGSSGARADMHSTKCIAVGGRHWLTYLYTQSLKAAGDDEGEADDDAAASDGEPSTRKGDGAVPKRLWYSLHIRTKTNLVKTDFPR